MTCCLVDQTGSKWYSWPQYVSNIVNIYEKLLYMFFPMIDRMWATLKFIVEDRLSLITYFPMTNRGWATLDTLWKEVSLPVTNREWVILHILRKTVSSHLCYDQQRVSDIAHFVKGNLITSFPMTNSLWVALYMCEGVFITSFPMTDSEWVTLQIYSCHIFSYDQQQVSDIAHFVKVNFITSFPMTNRKWVTLYVLWKAGSSHLFPWPIACEQHYILQKAFWPHLFLQPTGSEWHWAFCERQSHHIFSYDWQLVSDIAHVVKGSLIHIFPTINSQWVILHLL